jgi:glycosyltransferase involved in cell wall biosynthesis
MLMSFPRLTALTQGDEQPGRRFRWLQYVSDIKAAGFDVQELSSRYSAYAPPGRIARVPWFACSLMDSLNRVLSSRRSDLVFLQRSLIATLTTWERFIRPPYVMDVDDAIFLGSRGKSAGLIAKRARVTICGNEFLADYFSKFGTVFVLPTAVDTNLFAHRERSCDDQVIGWSGSSSGFEYLHHIEDAIAAVLYKYPRARLKIVADRQPVFTKLPHDRVHFEKWTPERQVQSLQEFSVGLMPLTDTPWARGKCSYKMLTYMSVGVPVVVSPVGMNATVLSHGMCGFAASTRDEWVDAMSSVLSDDDMAERLGRVGRRVVEDHYSRHALAPRLIDVLRRQL